MCHFAYRLVKLPTSDKQEYEHVDDQVLGGLGCSEFFLACVSFLNREELIKHSPRGQSESDIGLDFHSFRCFFLWNPLRWPFNSTSAFLMYIPGTDLHKHIPS